MSKPDPNITANLLNSIMEQRTEVHEAGSAGALRKSPSEASPKATAGKAGKLGPNRKAPGPGHMRSSPRGK